MGKMSKWFYEGPALAPLYEDDPLPYTTPVYTELSEVTEEEWAEAARVNAAARTRYLYVARASNRRARCKRK